MLPSIPLHQEPYKDLDIRLFGQEDKAAYRIAVSPKKLVDEKGFKEEEARAYALEYAKLLVTNMPLTYGFTVGYQYSDAEKSWDINVQPPQNMETSTRFQTTAQWRNDPNAAMVAAFTSAHKIVVTKMVTIDPESFRRTTARPVTMAEGGVGSTV